MQMICEAYDFMRDVPQALPTPEIAPNLRRMEHRRPRFLPHRDHRRHPRPDRSLHRQALRRHRPRHRRPEGHRQVDQRRRARNRRPRADHGRGRLRTQHQSARDESLSSRPPSILKGPEVGAHAHFRRLRCVQLRRRRPRRPLLLQDLLLRTGLRPYESAGREHDWNPNFGDHRLHLARRLHHPRPLPPEASPRPTARRADLQNLLLDQYFASVIERCPDVTGASRRRPRRRPSASPFPPSPAPSPTTIPIAPNRLPANLLQAQRDYFGAHTYERIDEPRGVFFHLDWPHPDRPQARA
jgi:hypothetical protein